MDYNNFFQQTPKKEGEGWGDQSGSQQLPTGQFSSSNFFSQKPLGSGFTTGGFGQNQTGGATGSIFGSTGSNFGSSNFNTNPLNKSGFGTNTGIGGGMSTTGIGGMSTTGIGGGMNTTGIGGLNTTGMGGLSTSGMGTSGFGSNSTFGSTSGFNSGLSNTGIVPSGFGSSSGFGNQQASTTSSGFGATSQFWGASKQPLGSSSLGASGLGTSTLGSSTWGSNTRGSKLIPYRTTRIKEENGIYGDLIDITGMKEYSTKAVDEIRKEDYEMSQVPPKEGSFISNSSFSTGIGFPSSQGFGSTSQQPSFGTSTQSSFGTSTQPSFGTSTQPSFGTSTQPTFGSSTQPSFGSTSQQPSFGTSTQPTFGSTTQQSSIFGSSPKPFTSSVSTPNLFSSNTLGTPASSFGSSFQQPAQSLQQPSSVFGSSTPSNSATPFSTAPSFSLGTQPSTTFGTTSTPTFSSGLSLGANPTGNLTSSIGPTTTPSSTPSNIFGSAPTTNLFGSNNTNSFALKQPDSSMTTPSPFSSVFSKPSQPSAPVFGSDFARSSLQPSPFTSTAAPVVDLSDPYKIKNIEFEKFEPQKPSVRVTLPSPIFNTNKDVPVVELKIRPPRPIPKNTYYTIPDLKDIDTSQKISNLVVGLEGKGRIEYLEPVSVSSLDEIEKKITFINDNIDISDPVGHGLNKKARVYIEGFYPVSRITNDFIKGKATTFPEKGIQERFIYQLKSDSRRVFVDYNVDTGVYVYELNHF